MRYRIFAAAALTAAVCFSGCKKVDDVPAPLTESLPEPTAMTFSEEAVPAAVTLSETAATVTSAETTEEAAPETLPRVIVPKLEWKDREWDREFMEDTIFVGDSVCRALYVYNDLLTTKQVAAAGGAAARNIYDFTYKMEGTEYTLKEAAEHYKPAVFFLWMGINDINMTDKPTYAANLKSIAEDLLSISPDSKVVILSMSPTADYHEWQANDRIRDYNAAAREMCEAAEEEEIYYLDIQDILSDEDGYLLPECDGGDGMHLSQMAYIRLLSYITASKDGFMPSDTAPVSEDTDAAPASTDADAAETAAPVSETEESEADESAETAEHSGPAETAEPAGPAE